MIDGLSDIRSVLRPSVEHNKLSMLHKRPVSLLNCLYRSRWRNSIPQVVRLLVESDDADERATGWKVAQEYGVKLSWTESEVDRLLNERSEAVMNAAIRSVASTDVQLLKKCIEHVLNDPAASISCKNTCLSLLNRIPAFSDRIKLWSIAADDRSLRAGSISSFPSVSASESAVRVVVGFLEDTATVDVAVVDSVGRPTEIRTLACSALGSIAEHRHFALNEIRKKCMIPPNLGDLEFFIAGTMAIHNLEPESDEPAALIAEWYDALAMARPILLQRIEADFTDSEKLEVTIVSRLKEMPPDQRCGVCRWLSNRQTSEARDVLKELLHDKHIGVRVAAAVAICKVDPLFELSAVRDGLLKHASMSPDEFMMAFSSMNSAIIALASAGQSDDDAVNWLKVTRAERLQAICNEALEELTPEPTMRFERSIQWKRIPR